MSDSVRRRPLPLRGFLSGSSTHVTGLITNTAVLCVDFQGRRDLSEWLGYMLAGGEDSSPATWTGEPNRPAPRVTLNVQTTQPRPSAFRVVIPADTEQRIEYLRLAQHAGWIGLTALLPEDLEQNPRMLIRIEIPREPLGKLLDAAEARIKSRGHT